MEGASIMSWKLLVLPLAIAVSYCATASRQPVTAKPAAKPTKATAKPTKPAAKPAKAVKPKVFNF
ncbi:MAG: hypothetical protein J7M21_00530, partial [Planctomycetes bacterium]|nr:hypothetical protein [Planctomycetota bacterium]